MESNQVEIFSSTHLFRYGGFPEYLDLQLARVLEVDTVPAEHALRTRETPARRRGSTGFACPRSTPATLAAFASRS
jgi:hypothetical protein